MDTGAVISSMGVGVPWGPESLYNSPHVTHAPGMECSPLTQVLLAPPGVLTLPPEASVHLVSESLSSSMPQFPHLQNKRECRDGVLLGGPQVSLKRGWVRPPGDGGTLGVLGMFSRPGLSLEPAAPFIIHDSEGSPAAAGSPGRTVATETGLVTGGLESSLGLTRKGLSKDLGQGCPLLDLSLPNLESESNLIHYHQAPAPWLYPAPTMCPHGQDNTRI